MKNLSIIILFITNQAFSQFSIKNITVNPYLGYGISIPGRNQVVGSERLTNEWQPGIVTGKLKDGLIRSTNTYGLDFKYPISEKVNISFDLARNSHLLYYKTSMPYKVNNYEIVGYYFDYKYFSTGLGFWYETPQTEFFFKTHFIPNIYNYAEKKSLIGDSDDTDFVSGIGLKQELVWSNEIKAKFSLGFYKKVELLDNHLKIGVVLDVSPQVFFTDKFSFYQNNRYLSENTINFLINSVSGVVSIPIKRNETIKKKKPENPVFLPEEVEYDGQVIEEGKSIVLENIKFEQTKFVLSPAGMNELDIVYDFLLENPRARIELSGHTSSEGSKAQNMELSKKRAEMCKDYLVKKGIKSTRIRAYGLGSERPISSGNQELNRRVEMRIYVSVK